MPTKLKDKEHVSTSTSTTTDTRPRLHTAIAPRATLAMGAVGAVVGGSVAAARNIGKVHHDEMTRQEAVVDTIKEAGTTGVSTAAGAAVVSAAGLTGALSLVGMIGVAVGVKYLADKALAPKHAYAAVEDEETKAAKPAAKKKTAKK